MAPKSQWTKKATINNNAQKTNAAEHHAPAAINYGEAQSEEIEALRAIYMDDYEQVEVKGAWSTTTDRSFTLKIRSFSDEAVFVTLSVRLTATYPKSVPLLSISGLERYHDRTQKRINNIIQSRPKQLLGEVMTHTIANEIQDALEDAYQARQQGTLPSLEDERASAEETAAQLARQAQEAEHRRQQEEQRESETMLKQMVDEEVHRREQRKPTKSASDDTSSVPAAIDSDVIIFDQVARLNLAGGSAHFSRVSLVATMSQSREQTVFLAKPQLVDNQASSPVVVVKRIVLQKSRDDIQELETCLSSVVALRHPGLLALFAYRIERMSPTKSELIVCEEHADRGSLQDILRLAQFTTEKSKRFTIEILEALDFLHRSGMVHGSVCASNISLVGSEAVAPKLSGLGYCRLIPLRNEISTRWPAPAVQNQSNSLSMKTDIWQLGVLVAQLFLGTEILDKYSSPHSMLARMDFSDSFDDILRKLFVIDPKKRPTAFDLLPAEFLRTGASPVDQPQQKRQDQGYERYRTGSRGADDSPAKQRPRLNSSNVLEPVSRYANDFTELGRLGKGGFGEVVKARNKLDGGVYAVKKIKQAPRLLDQVISEVMLLNRLNHPYVVRYFSTWIEEDMSGALIEDSTTETETTSGQVNGDDTSDGPQIDFGFQSVGGLDFVSSSGAPHIQFGDDSDEESSDDEDFGEVKQPVLQDDADDVFSHNQVDGAMSLRRSRSDVRRAPSTLYIQMEYCERHTLRDLVRKTIKVDDCWRYARHITEGLAHIHGHGIIHRDLKPDNIFIDVAGNPKIGDFGLATTTQHQSVERAITMSGVSNGNMTRSVGTTLYIAPELRSASGTSYNDKVDMYSLGIIFYEMCEPFSTAMERIKALQRIREKDDELPTAFLAQGEKAAQGRLISCLIAQKPSERPSSTELLRSDILPIKIEDETIRKALSGLSDARSPYHQKMMSALFSHQSEDTARVKALAWDARSSGSTEDANRLRLRNIARHTLQDIFRRHGAEEALRQTIFPRSGYYTNANIFQILDASGNLLQLPYDLTLPHARQLASQRANSRCTYSFGNAYRDLFDGGPPKVSEEVDFDVVDSGKADEYVFNDAEVIKMMDEVVSEMPLFSLHTTAVFHLNHSDILTAILEFCRVPPAQHLAVKEMLSRLGFHQYTWSKIRVDLRQFGLPDSALDDLQQFDFRDVPAKAFARLGVLFTTANARTQSKLSNGVQYLTDMVQLLSQFGLKRNVYIAPLGSVNARFYEHGMLFQCVLERKTSKVVIAAGGRYDTLIRAHRSMEAQSKPQGAVGVSIGLDPVISTMMRNWQGSAKKAFARRQAWHEDVPKRCNVLVTTSGNDAARNAGIKLLTNLWDSRLSAELCVDQNIRQEDYDFVVTLRHEGSHTVKVVTTESRTEETEIPLPMLISHLQQELRDRDTRKLRTPSLLRQASQSESERKTNVHVLMARFGSKKANKFNIVADAQEQWSAKLDAAKDAPILAVETRDEIIDAVQQTKLGDAESWRRAVQGVPLNDRQYVQQIHDMLASWRKKWEDDDGLREACVFNFRTQRCIYYDLGL